MGNKFFLHQVRLGTASTTKGIVIHNTYDDAKQGYHAYLGAYAYGHDQDAICVQAMITDRDGSILMSETWNAPHEEPVEE